MKILTYIPILLGILLGGYTTNIVKNIGAKKEARHTARILKQKSDSIAIYQDSTAHFKATDSLKGEFIKQYQTTFKELSKINRNLKKDSTTQAIVIKDLKSWIEDARDGVVTDTIEYKTNFWGKRKKIKP